jgi:hypothetical protein
LFCFQICYRLGFDLNRLIIAYELDEILGPYLNERNNKPNDAEKRRHRKAQNRVETPVKYALINLSINDVSKRVYGPQITKNSSNVQEVHEHESFLLLARQFGIFPLLNGL